jgi:hypothetical protein
MVAGPVAVALLPDFPSSGKEKWLTEQEQCFAEWRLARAANDEVDENGSINKEALPLPPEPGFSFLFKFASFPPKHGPTSSLYAPPLAPYSFMSNEYRQLPKRWATATILRC